MIRKLREILEAHMKYKRTIMNDKELFSDYIENLQLYAHGLLELDEEFMGLMSLSQLENVTNIIDQLCAFNNKVIEVKSKYKVIELFYKE